MDGKSEQSNRFSKYELGKNFQSEVGLQAHQGSGSKLTIDLRSELEFMYGWSLSSYRLLGCSNPNLAYISNWHQGHEVLSPIGIGINKWSHLLLLHLSYFLTPSDFLKGVGSKFWVTEGWPLVREGLMVGFVPNNIHVGGSTSYGETKIGPCPMKNQACFFEMVWSG